MPSSSMPSNRDSDRYDVANPLPRSKRTFQNIQNWAPTQTSIIDCQWAILGTTSGMGSGILAWFRNRSDADRAFNNLLGYYGPHHTFKIVKATPGGDLVDEDEKYVHDLIFS